MNSGDKSCRSTDQEEFTIINKLRWYKIYLYSTRKPDREDEWTESWAEINHLISFQFIIKAAFTNVPLSRLTEKTDVIDVQIVE